MKKALFASIITGCLLLLCNTMQGQELKCEVQVNSSQISGSDKTIFQNLQSALYEFINNTKWTEINFRTNEKIECTIVINVTKRSDTQNFAGEINIALSRPVYKSSYTSPVFNYIDTSFPFEYIDGQSLDFNPSSYMSDVTSTIGFYVYLMLGYDFDTFSLYGGEPFFKVAEVIASSAPQDGEHAGWSTTSLKNRYAIIENFMNPSYKPLRQFLYEYHRLGLDVMSEKPDEGRAAITKSLAYLQDIHKSYPNCYILTLITETKRSEFISIYSQGSQQEKVAAINILKEIDPSHSSEYDAILEKK